MISIIILTNSKHLKGEYMLITLLIALALLIFLHIKKYSFNLRTVLALIIGISIGILYNYTGSKDGAFYTSKQYLS